MSKNLLAEDKNQTWESKMLLLSLCLLIVVISQLSYAISPVVMANEIVKTLSSKKKEVLLARSISKVAVYARAFFPNLVFSVMASGVQSSAAALDQDL